MKKPPTYYKIVKYLVSHGLTAGQAHYVRNLVRELVKDKKADATMSRHYGE